MQRYIDKSSDRVIDMKVVSFASGKGGVGKSTLAINCACVAVEEERAAAIIDLDPQKSSGLWAGLRAKRGRKKDPEVVVTNHRRLKGELEKLKAAKVDWVFIDTPGRSTVDVNAAIEASTLALVPSRPIMIDLEPAGEIVGACMRLGKGCACLMNLVPPRAGKSVNEVIDYLEMAGLRVCPVTIAERADYIHAFSDGAGVVDLKSNNAASEIRRLWRRVREHA